MEDENWTTHGVNLDHNDMFKWINSVVNIY